jgi:TolB-like protein
MKKCQQCGREYDLSMSFCLDDGSELLYGPGRGGRLSETCGLTGLSPGLAEEPKTAILSGPATGASEFNTAVFQPPAAAGGSDQRAAKPLLFAAAAAVLLLVGGFFAYRYFNTAAPGQIESIAVMPFVNESGNADVEYLSDGMTETLISSLSQLPELSIRPRSVVFRYKGRDASPEDIGRELGVEAVLIGRVTARGSDLSLFAELIDVTSTKVIWSRRYDRRQSDIVALQSEIARDVSGKINGSLSNTDEQKVSKSGTANPEAYRLYLLANSLVTRRKTKDLRTALGYYQQALALDPKYALAHVGVASSYVYLTIYGGEDGAVELPKARAAVARALEIDPTLPEAYNIFAGIEFYLNRDFAANERLNKRALEINPKFANAYRHNGLRAMFTGKFDEAITNFRRALEFDPMSIAAYSNLGSCLYYSGKINESEAELTRSLQIDPTFWFVELQLFINARARGDHAAAVQHLVRAQELREEPDAAKFIQDAFARSGWAGMLRAALAEPERSRIWDYHLAGFAVELRDHERAFEHLKLADAKYDQFIFFAKIDPKMDPLRSDPRFAELLKKLGFSETN